MTKRRLNQHQQRRISGNQQAHQERNVRDDASATAVSEAVEGNSLDGLIVCHYGKQIDVESLAPEHKGEVFRCFQRSNLPAMVTGDKVLWQIEEGQSGVIVAQQPRHSAMSRPNHRGELRAIAANVDCAVVVIAPKPEPFGNLIDRYMVAIEHLGLRPLLLLNKSDLTTKGSIDVEALLKRYARIGYQTLRVSSHSGDGMEELRQALADYTAVFVGQSGVGKSSLINTLRGLKAGDEEVAQVGDLSVSHHKGTHTTTATRLYHLPGSGDLIDSPGIREFGLWHIESDALMDGFVEFRPLAGRCRFRDCRHKHEPDCALLEAVKRGEIDEARLESYHHILASLEEKS
ncbi:MAG: small ribosomal subunit biogenesis GTPase RsgA [Pseudohongiella sp.]|nr:small ribosomal subunit biogenesis GTPase RsgA [Pseudohongiella sp.]MDO9519148.1 small ribosomal subunit biogenesis GTPase RsgA [Pseudohongiella sp.]MDP2125812.1 small ribosomal subunit biogenesis GTPase RsgA [Pseudohongiella sp.]